MKEILIGLAIFSIALNCSAQQKIQHIERQVQAIKQDERTLKRKVAIARFTNESQYAKGAFYDAGNNPVEKQAADILATKLAASGKFLLLERQDWDKVIAETKLNSGQGEIQKVGADYLIIGSVTEFGRKNVGDRKAFAQSKTQTVSAAVSLRLVDVSTGQIIYSEEGKGEATAVAKTVVGFGKTADYDATLNDKAISVAISQLVENIINNCMNRPWKAYFLAYDDSGILVSGGKSQGLNVGDIFDIYEKGRSVKNPQTEMMIELPGKVVGKVKIDVVAGDTPQNEYSIVSFTEGGINKQNFNNYIIKEIKK